MPHSARGALMRSMNGWTISWSGLFSSSSVSSTDSFDSGRSGSAAF
jgi:hypothetical protein